VRLNATAPTCPSLRDNASARITAALGLKHSASTILGAFEQAETEPVGKAAILTAE
jgi:hypothetical protein